MGRRQQRGGDPRRPLVSDDDPAIPREMQARIFDPFFTTKQVGESTGLGLDIARRIIEAHGGDVTFDSKPGNTRFVVRLPLEGRRQGARAG